MADHPIPDISGPAAVVAASQEEIPAAGVDLANEKAQQNMSKEEKKVEKEKVHLVPFYKLFSFADRWDYILMIIGSIGAIGNGVSMPLMTIIFGALTNAFGNNQGDQSAVVREVSKVAVKFVYIGIGAAVASYLPDDEYTIIGSANINQRSLDGARDSEIAIGAYQPFHLCAQRPPRSHIHGFRMSLWYEHIGKLDNAFLQPWTLDCIREVNAAADRHWEMWAGDEVVDMPGHLLSYPVQIDQDGTVSNLPGLEHFPDTQAKILGTKSESLPPILTT